MCWLAGIFRHSKPIVFVRHEMPQISASNPQKRGPYKCSRCDSEFRSRRNRQRHGKREHRDTAREDPVTAELPKSEFSAMRPKIVKTAGEAKGAETQEQGTSETQDQGKPETKEQGKPVIKEQGKPKTQEQGRLETPVQAQLKTQKKDKPKTQEQGKPKVQEQGKTKNKDKAKPENQKKGALKTQVTGDSKTLEEGEVKTKKSASTRIDRQIAREVRMETIEVIERSKKLRDNREPLKEVNVSKVRRDCAVAVAEKLRDKNDPEQQPDRKVIHKHRAVTKQQNDAMYRKLAGDSSKAMEIFGEYS